MISQPTYLFIYVQFHPTVLYYCLYYYEFLDQNCLKRCRFQNMILFSWSFVKIITLGFDNMSPCAILSTFIPHHCVVLRKE